MDEFFLVHAVFFELGVGFDYVVEDVLEDSCTDAVILIYPYLSDFALMVIRQRLFIIILKLFVVS